jgi:hypothetical protein
MKRILSVTALVAAALLLPITSAHAALNHIGPGPDAIKTVLLPGQTKTVHDGTHTATLTNLEIGNITICWLLPQDPHLGTGPLGGSAVIAQDVVDCDNPGVLVFDTLTLYHFLLSYGGYGTNTIWSFCARTIFGCLTTNTVWHPCVYTPIQPFWTLQSTGVNAPTGPASGQNTSNVVNLPCS